MIDSHCHLDHEPLYQNLNDVILRSKDAGITKLLTICTNLDSFENIKKIINLDPIIYGTFGIHPHDADKNLISKDKIINNSKYSKKTHIASDHFVTENGQIFAGHHYLIDMWDCLYLEEVKGERILPIS